jgi:hypothetical protein
MQGDGPRTISEARYDYNEAILRSFDYQMLLNLVRLRYPDSILFLDLTSVLASYTRELNIGVTPTVETNPLVLGGELTAGGLWSEEPTISNAPLQGEEFEKRLLAPIPPAAILLLSRSGCGLERILLFTVQQLNELSNGTAVGGIAPTQIEHFKKFRSSSRCRRQAEACSRRYSPFRPGRLSSRPGRRLLGQQRGGFGMAVFLRKHKSGVSVRVAKGFVRAPTDSSTLKVILILFRAGLGAGYLPPIITTSDDAEACYPNWVNVLKAKSSTSIVSERIRLHLCLQATRVVST